MPTTPVFANSGVSVSNVAAQLAISDSAYQFAAQNWPWVGLMSLITMPNADWLNDGNEQDEEQYWWAIMEPSPFAETRWREAYMVLCIYFNGLRGQQCQYAPPQ